MQQHGVQSRTGRLFDADAQCRSFRAQVLSCDETPEGTFEVVLDRTAFFPEGGGQPGDTGVLDRFAVLDTQERDGIIYHITADAIPPRTEISGRIDWPQRFMRMQNHSGEHLLSGLASTLYACTNVGFHLSREDGLVTVDFDRQLEEAQLRVLERIANQAVYENRSIFADYPSPEELEARSYRSKLALSDGVRLVTISGYDCCACCAPHVSSTGQIGQILILDHLHYKGGTRLVMACGVLAAQKSRQALDSVRRISVQLSAKPEDVAEAAARQSRRLEEQKAQYAALCRAYLEQRAAQLPETEGNLVLFEPLLDRNALRCLVNEGAARCTGICAGFTGSDESGWFYILASTSVDLRAEAKTLNAAMQGRGGGSSAMIQGSAGLSRAALEAYFRTDHTIQ